MAPRSRCLFSQRESKIVSNEATRAMGGWGDVIMYYQGVHIVKARPCALPFIGNALFKLVDYELEFLSPEPK